MLLFRAVRILAMKLFVILLLNLILLLSSGCTSTSQPSEPAAMTPIVIENYDGYAGQGKILRQVYERVPERILAVSEPVVDNLIFLGLQDKIAAVSECTVDSNWPHTKVYKDFRHLTENYGYPSKEAVLELHPDMVISWGSLFGESSLGSVEYWHQKGMHTYIMSNTVPVKSCSRKVENIIIDLQNLSKIFRIEKESAVKIEKLAARIAKLQSAVENIQESRRPGVITIQYVYGNEYYGRTDTDLTADIINLAGGRSLDDRFGGKKSVENLIKKDPDIILLVDMPKRPAAAKIKALQSNHALRNVKAIKNNNFFIIPYRAFYCGSEQTVMATEQLQTFMEKIMEKR